MRIGIDARTILNPEKGDNIGVGHYTYQLIRHLLDIDTENEYVLFFDYRVREKDVKKFDKPNVKIKFYPFSDYKKYLPGAYSELLGRATLAREDLDILHSTSPVSRIPLGYRGLCLTTINNLGVFKEPDAYPKVRCARERGQIRYMASKSDMLIAVSNSIRDDLHNLFHIDEKKIRTIHSGLDERFFEEAPIDGKKVLEKFGITKKYILYMGTLAPINNVSRLIQAFFRFKEEYIKNDQQNHFPYQLVLAGKKGWLSQEYRQEAKDAGVEKDVVFPGYVVGDDLVPLFKGAEFFVMPSLYEGFGTTVLEAMATGVPVIASKVSSLPEVAGDASKFVNPLSTEEIAQAMGELSGDDEQRKDLRKKGLEQAKQYSWKKVAQRTLDVYKELGRMKMR